MFTHEKFEAYQLSIEFVALAFSLMEELPAGYSSLRDQFRKAAISIPLNIAEGTGKNSQTDRKRFYAIARGSAMECAAICDLIGMLDDKFVERTEQGKETLKSAVRILSTVCSGQPKAR